MNGKLNGLVITIFADQGPYPLINMSPLDHDKIMKLSVLGMTILSMGGQTPSQELFIHRLHGPIPVPDTLDYEAFSMSFSVSTSESTDERLLKHGRISTVWIIFDSKYRNELVSLHNEIEEVLTSEIKNIKQESELEVEETIKNIQKRLQQVTEQTPVAALPSTVETRIVQDEQAKAVLFYTVNMQSEVSKVTADFLANPSRYPVLIMVNTVLKRIFVVKNNENVSNRLMFVASRAASKLNAQHWKNEFQKKDISDPLEGELLIEQASILIRDL
ncbi:MAG: hypothetical protein ACXAEU_21355 [Candidatus Hodarchaeales archaeon]